MKIAIKNVCCQCCELYVKHVLQSLEMEFSSFQFGVLTLESEASEDQLNRLDEQLRFAGLELVSERKNMLVERLKSLLHDLDNQCEKQLKTNISDYLSEQLQHNYSYLSNLFSMTVGMTIREYVISLRIERVKRMLTLEQLDLLDISVRLHYSSVAHLAAQFKKVTGYTTTEFRRHAQSGTQSAWAAA